MKRSRIPYAVAGIMLLIIEILIALYVHDDFIRPYVGDALVTVLICCLCRIVIPKGLPALPVYVFLFAALVEIAQYFDVVALLGLQNNALLSILIGRTFSLLDLICYAVGCATFALAEMGVKAIMKSKRALPR